MHRINYMMSLISSERKGIWMVSFILNSFQTFLVNIIFGFSIKLAFDFVEKIIMQISILQLVFLFLEGYI